MNYQTFQPNADLEPFVKCYWTLEVPADNHSERQRIIPDGCIEMAFILGDDIKRYTSEDKTDLKPLQSYFTVLCYTQRLSINSEVHSRCCRRRAGVTIHET